MVLKTMLSWSFIGSINEATSEEKLIYCIIQEQDFFLIFKFLESVS